MGGSHLNSAVIDLESRKVCSESLVTPMDSSAPGAEVLDCFRQNLLGSIEGFGGEVAQIGLAFPGPFDYNKGVSYMEHKFEHLYGIDLPQALRNLLQKPGLEFRFVNDASAFALGECFCGSAQGRHRVLALTLGTGVGSGFVVDGVLDDSSEAVPAGGEVWNLPFENTIVDDSFSTRWFVRRYLQLAGKQVKGAKEVAEGYGTDPASTQIFNEYGSRLGSFATPVLERFGADTLVLGGNISRNFKIFEGPLKAALPAGVEVRTSTLLDRAAIIGSASLFSK